MMRPVIVGGGLAGGAAAARLAQLGHHPLLLERTAGPHDKICGEFLSPEASQHLAAVGFDVGRLGGTHITHVRVRSGTRTASSALPFVATGIRRHTLDAALLEHAAACGAEVQQGVTVQQLAHRSDAHDVITAQGSLTARTVLLATGKHDMRGYGRDHHGTVDGFIGFKQYIRATPAQRRAQDGVVDIIAFSGGYAGLQLVASNCLNLCLLIERARFQALGGTWTALWDALLREPGLAMLGDGEPLLQRPLTIAGVPYGFLVDPTAPDGLYRLGDQAAVIPSFCGDGMAIALHSGRRAADAVHAGAPAPWYQTQVRRDVAKQVRLALRVQHMMHRPLGRVALITGLAAIPGALRLLARWTRVAPDAVAQVIA